MSKAKPDNPTSWNWVVTSELADMRLDRCVSLAMAQDLGQWSKADASTPPSLSRSQIARALEENRLQVSFPPECKNLETKASTPLPEGTRVELTVPPPLPSELVPEERELAILYEDDAILIVNKPPGLTVHPSATQLSGTLVHALLARSRQWSGVGGVLRPGIVHRIDKNTSGSLVIAKNDIAHRKLVETFSAHAIERTYWALVYGSVDSQWKRVESLIDRHPTDRKLMSMHVKSGRKAITDYRGLENYGSFAALVEARLQTGRTHQVRVHLTGEHHSLLGDPIYGKPTATASKWRALPRSIQEAVKKLPGQALHARTLGFAHPITGERIFVQAPLYPEMQTLLNQLRAL